MRIPSMHETNSMLNKLTTAVPSSLKLLSLTLRSVGVIIDSNVITYSIVCVHNYMYMYGYVCVCGGVHVCVSVWGTCVCVWGTCVCVGYMCVCGVHVCVCEGGTCVCVCGVHVCVWGGTCLPLRMRIFPSSI